MSNRISQTSKDIKIITIHQAPNRGRSKKLSKNLNTEKKKDAMKSENDKQTKIEEDEKNDDEDDK